MLLTTQKLQLSIATLVQNTVEEKHKINKRLGNEVDGQPQIKHFRDDYKYLEGTSSFYKIHTIQKTWEQAKKRCALEGATLFYPEDQNEVDVVLAHLKETQPMYAWIFVGISSKLAKGVFTTVDGVAIRHIYNRWGHGEPNDANGEEDCVILRKEGTYNDEKCSNKFPFICKKTLQSLKWNEECNTPYLDYKYNVDLGRCYKFHLHPLTWREAVEACDAEQAYLAIINSQQEASHLVNITASAPKDKVQGWYLRGAVHLGFNYDTTEEDWRTTTGETLEQAGYAMWGNYQPDGGESERCGSMFYNGHLNDIGCEGHRCFFICEKENELLSLFDDRFGI
ncbi:Hemolymph lipopolysaccharide-binding protein [Papilio xuthus]|uniref:Hemolymph lipopolysaccharide-binding protein n=1 Tax=Papilio xuthus TaxID=66420 RepID=A0A194PEZ5_PAPXU|nr:Hemolymph lipopolysaccharide-binding protein [Papilio xuthus]